MMLVNPSVSAPIGVFFGSGFGRYVNFMNKFVGMTMGAYVSNFHMPFKNSAKVTLVNKLKNKGIPRVYLNVEHTKYNSENDVKNKLYFHAKYLEQKYEYKPFEILNLKKSKGHFVGVTLNSQTKGFGKGFLNLEGNVKMYIDGEVNPSMEYTGTEDFFAGAWYYVKPSDVANAEFYAPYHGLTYKSFGKYSHVWASIFAHIMGGKTSQYRFFPDGIPFDNNFKCTFNVGEFNEIPAEYNSVAYWYQTKP